MKILVFVVATAVLATIVVAIRRNEVAPGSTHASGAAPPVAPAEVSDLLSAFPLSDSIIELGLYEDGGMHLQFDTSRASPASVERDIRQAVTMVQSLRPVRVAH